MKYVQIDFVDNTSILVVNNKGKMKQLFVPFKVQVAREIDGFKVSQSMYVDEVKNDHQFRLLYRVDTRWFPYDFFFIKINF